MNSTESGRELIRNNKKMWNRAPIILVCVRMPRAYMKLKSVFCFDVFVIKFECGRYILVILVLQCVLLSSLSIYSWPGHIAFGSVQMNSNTCNFNYCLLFTFCTIFFLYVCFVLGLANIIFHFVVYISIFSLIIILPSKVRRNRNTRQCNMMWTLCICI